MGTLLDTNRTMLEKGGARRPKSVPAGVKIIDPVYIEDDVTLIDSTIGPNVSISAGSRVEKSTLVDTIVGGGATVRNAKLDEVADRRRRDGRGCRREGERRGPLLGRGGRQEVEHGPIRRLSFGIPHRRHMISVRDLTKLYSNLTAVSHLSFDIGPGEVLGLVGPNGAGKTTTLRCLCGIMAPSAGKIAIAGHDIQTDSVEAKRALAFIPDEPHLFDYLTVEEHLRFVARLYGVADAEERRSRRSSASSSCSRSAPRCPPSCRAACGRSWRSPAGCSTTRRR